MKNYTTFGEPLTQAIAQDIIRRCETRAGYGPASEQLDRVMTYSQRREVVALWHYLPGRFSVWSTIEAVANGTIDEYVANKPGLSQWVSSPKKKFCLCCFCRAAMRRLLGR